MFTPSAPITIPPMVSVFTKGIGWVGEDYAVSSPTSGTYEGNPITVYLPILLPSSCVVKRVWWVNGGTVSGGATVECGIYADTGSFQPGARLVYGSATQGNANEIQFVDVTGTSLPPGVWWIALTASTNTNTTLFRAAVGAVAFDAVVRFQESVNTLPTTATPIEASTGTLVYLCGFSTTSGTTDIPAPPSTWAKPAPITIPPMVSVFTKGIGWVGEDDAGSAPSSASFNVTQVIYHPIVLPSSCVVKRVWWTNGTSVAGTIGCGVYADSGSFSPGMKLVSGSATQSGTSSVQFVDVTDTHLPPGLYWLALVTDNANTYFMRAAHTATSVYDMRTLMYEAATTLPDTATPLESNYSADFLFGFSTTSSP